VLLGTLLEDLQRSLGIERCAFHVFKRRGNFRGGGRDRGGDTASVIKASLDELCVRSHHGYRIPQIMKRRPLFLIGQGGWWLGIVVGWRHEHFPA